MTTLRPLSSPPLPPPRPRPKPASSQAWVTAAAGPLLFRTLLRDPIRAASRDRLRDPGSVPGSFWGLAEAGKWQADPFPGPQAQRHLAQRLGTPAAFGSSNPGPLHSSHVLLEVLP